MPGSPAEKREMAIALMAAYLKLLFTRSFILSFMCTAASDIVAKAAEETKALCSATIYVHSTSKKTLSTRQYMQYFHADTSSVLCIIVTFR